MKNKGRVEYAATHARDAQGHFIHEVPEDPQHPQHAIVKLLKESIHYSKTQNDLLDVRIGNPLEKAIELLQQIKKQKAFSFTIKGSLGILGVALVLSFFGVFGGSKMLCDKGVQTEIGTVRVLPTQEIEASNVFLIGPFIDAYNSKLPLNYSKLHNRVILVKQDNSTVYIPHSRDVQVEKYVNQQVLATGSYDSCSSTLKVSDPQSILPL